MAFLPEDTRPNVNNHVQLVQRCHRMRQGDTLALSGLPPTVDNATSLMYHIGYVFPIEAISFIAHLEQNNADLVREIGVSGHMLRFWTNQVREGRRHHVRDANPEKRLRA